MLQDYLDAEISWRIKELANLKIAISQPRLEKKTLIRAAVCIMYAHWEGFVKSASLAYLNLVNNQRLNYDKLSACFVVFGVKKYLHDLKTAARASVNIAAVEFFLSNLQARAQLKLSRAVDTESNLSSTVFDNIAVSIGIDPSGYQHKYHLIDQSILNRRNRIAHGEYLDLEENECRTLVDEVISLIRAFKTDIENCAFRGSFRR